MRALDPTPMPRRVVSILALALGFLLQIAFSPSALAHDDGRPLAVRGVDFEQKLNHQVPLDLRFRDETGKTVELADYIKTRPVILNFVYFKCRDLCPMLLNGMVRALRPLSFGIGKEFDVLTVSFDPSDNPALAAAKRSDYLKEYGRPGADNGWHFLTGDETSIRQLTQSVGFLYNYDPRTGEFGHATGLVLLTPQGKASRYFYGIEFSPRDLRLGLVEAASGKIGSPIDQLLLFCFHYDPMSGKYNLLVTRVLRIAGIATVLLIAGYIFVMLRRERAQSGGRLA